jgi:hypothetical protein
VVGRMNTPIAHLQRSSAVHFAQLLIRPFSLRSAGSLVVPAACRVFASLLTRMHALRGTQEVLATVVLLLVAISDAALYNLPLWKAETR